MTVPGINLVRRGRTAIILPEALAINVSHTSHGPWSDRRTNFKVITGTSKSGREPRSTEACRPPAPKRLDVPRPSNSGSAHPNPSTDCTVALLTGGGDKPYALGLASALTSERIALDFIGSDDL